MLTHVHVPEHWDNEILRAGGSFLQSWEWGTFQERAGFKTLHLRDEHGVPSLWLDRPMPFGKRYWYCPRGPLASFAADYDVFKGATFLRAEPSQVPEFKKLTNGRNLKWRKVHPQQPAQTIILDLSKSEEQLMKEMHQKTRYNVGLAERKGVRVYHARGKDANAFETFWALVGETTNRRAFSSHEKSYYRTMLETLAGDPEREGKKRPVAQLVFAEHDGRVLAANLMIWFGDTVTYLHGASSNVRREVMAPHALHWELIKEAKRWGYADYDFWGVAPEAVPAGRQSVERHPLAGVSRFKRGWGGTYVQYPGTFDLPLDKLAYFAYSLVRRLRP